MEMREKFLPIGSVVLLRGGTKKVMVTGFCSIADDDNSKVYDYTGCIYPEGYLNSNQICLFDHEQIEQICYLGYEDEEEKEFKVSLLDIVNKYKSGLVSLDDEKIESEIDDNDESNNEEESNLDLEYL